ncbi:hypothetical protein PMAYCL1PPCAC_16732, partial [Pristionchus mayeri]
MFQLVSSSNNEIISELPFNNTGSFAYRYLGLLHFCDGEPNDSATIALRNACREKHNVTIYDGWIVMEYWPNGRFALKPFLLLLYADIFLLSSFLTVISLATMTFYHIRINTAFSEYYRRLQRKVLIALCAQTAVPLLCVYLPYVSILNTPFFDINDFVSPEMSASVVSAFPLWDAAVIILLMKDYRDGAVSMLWRRRKPRVIAVTQAFTTCNV